MQVVTAKCIQKFRDKQNRIYGYRLQDQQGNIRDIKSEELKRAIANKQIDVLNLKLTSDHRLVDKDVKVVKVQQSTLEKKVEAALIKAKIIGASAPEALYALACQEGFQDIIELSETACEGNKVKLSTRFKNYKDALEHPEATIFVTGMAYLFYDCEAKTLDLSNFNTSNVTDMGYMFYYCQAKTLGLSNFNTSKVTDMQGMFHTCQAQILDLRSFNTSNVTDMDCMFRCCMAEVIDLSRFNTSKVTNMADMFESCQAQTLDISSFDTSNVTNMSGMFYNCQARTLDLSSFDISKVTDMSGMFEGCKAETINLSSFNTFKVTDMTNMFYDCKAKIKATDPRIISKYNNR